jgi:hypothetical protein
MHHAVEAGEGGASAVIPVGVEPFLGKNITAGLGGKERRSAIEIRGWKSEITQSGARYGAVRARQIKEA